MEYITMFLPRFTQRPSRKVTLPTTKTKQKQPMYHIEITRSQDDHVTKCKIRGFTKSQAIQIGWDAMRSDNKSYHVVTKTQEDRNYSIVVTTDESFGPGHIPHLIKSIRKVVPGSDVQCYYR